MESQITEKEVLVRVNKKYQENMPEDELFEITRGVWVIGARREKADYAFAVYKGVVKEVYKISGWYPAGTLQYSTRKSEDVKIDGRWEFRGCLADKQIRDKYIGMDIKKYIPAHASNPIMYVNC